MALYKEFVIDDAGSFDDTRSNYWYFRFIKDFFNDPKMCDMKELERDLGYKYIVIYLEIAGLSVDYGGYIRIKKGKSQLPFQVAIASRIGEDVQVVIDAIAYLIEDGLIEVLENEEASLIHIPYVKKNIGRGSRDGDRKRLERQRKKEEGLLPFVEHSEAQNVLELGNKTVYGIFNNVLLSDEEKEKLDEIYSNSKSLIASLSAKKKREGMICESDFEEIIKIGMKEGRVRGSVKIDYETLLKEAKNSYK